MRFNMCQLAIVIIFSLMLTACGEKDPQIVANINVQGTTIDTGKQRGLSVDVVSSADVRFEWSTTAGTLSNSSSQSVIFTAPYTPGPVVVTVKVISGDQITTDSINFDVIAPTPTQTPTPKPSSTPEPSLTPTNTAMPSNTPTPINTYTPTPTFTPTLTPSPLDCSDSKIVPGIFVQLADESTSSFAGSSDNAKFECEGVYALSNETPPAVRIDYKAISGTFAFFGIGISDGFDVTEFSEICVWVYAEESGQRFDLKLEDANGGNGVLINTTKTTEWDEHCVSLDGYPGVDLSDIKVITLSFNDSFGDAAIWVDDFELKK